ncbi:hypothetical protein NCS52_00948500 [Fusarium sp. LHS14.1]|nr:hypothetical protein NCS52_00948500 [Fusarium sp. LHS14.1]
MTPDSTDLTPAELEAQDAQLIRAGFYAARLELFPRHVLGINTRTILYGDDQPTSNPELTAWALGNALMKCSGKFLSQIDTTKPVRPLEIRMKNRAYGREKEPFSITFNGSQNADALLRHLYGDAGEPSEQCSKCREGKGALVECVVIKGIESCAKCSWNRSGGPCSFCPPKASSKSRNKRKATEFEDESDSDSDREFLRAFLDREWDLRTLEQFREIITFLINHARKRARTAPTVE